MVWKPNVVVAAVVEHDGRFLLVEEDANGAHVINQPAGHLDAGETLLDAVVRETLEETAWHFRPEALIGVYRWPHPTRGVTYLRFAFTGRLLGHEPERALDHGIIRTLWLSADEVRQQRSRHRSPQVERCIDDYTAGHRYPLALLREFDAPEAC